MVAVSSELESCMNVPSKPVFTAEPRRMAVMLMLALATAGAAAADTAPSPRTIPIVSLAAKPEAMPKEDGPTRVIPLLLGTTAPLSVPDSGGRIELGPTGSAPIASLETTAAPAAPAPRIASLWPVDGSHATGRTVTLKGEAAGLDFSLVAPPGVPIREITVAAVSSAFILPGESVLRVLVGEELLGEQSLTSITEAETLHFPVPDGLLRPGNNSVRVEISLRHRLYCGAEASYDLWTKIDLGASGGVLESQSPAAGPLAFLAAAGIARGQGIPIVIRSVGGQDAPTLRQISEISRQLGHVMGGGLRFSTELPETATGPVPPVINLRRSAAAEADFRSGPDGAQILEVRADGDAIPSLFDAAEIAEMLPPLPVLRTDTPVPLSELGFETVGVSGHLWSRSLGFRLPEDWLIDVNDRAVLRLDFAHVGGLPTGAELHVRVNGAIVRLVPLDRGARAETAPLEIRFDAGDLRAGRNELAFDVSVPGDPADQPCFGSELARVEIRDDSTLTVSSSPRMRLPGLGAWLSGGGSLSVEIEDSVGQQLDRLTALHELTTALDAPASRTDAPPRRLVMMRGDGLASAALGNLAVSRGMLLSAVQPPRPELVASVEPGATLPIEVVEAGFFGLQTADLEAHAIEALNRLRRLVLPDPAGELAGWLHGAQGQALLLQLDPATPDDVYLLLADDADPLEVARALAEVARRGAPLGGHAALLDRTGNWTTWRDPTRLPVLEETLNEQNWRGILGNFASARPRVFVGALIAVALLSVLIANSYIVASRRAR
jgi:hypothetical protein